MATNKPETSKERRERELREEFSNLSPELKKWGQEVDNSIIESLKSEKSFDYNNFVKLKFDFRLKDSDSFIKKALYRKAYSDPLKEIEDKIGTRVVVLTSNHMMQVRDILMSKTDLWECKIGRDKALIKESIKEFDYEAVHLIVKPLKGNQGFNQDNLDYLTCEIQIKTIFQHAYSEISHDTVYKGPYRHDLDLLRKLARSMALLESTDENFNSMYSYINSGKGLALNFHEELIQQFKRINPSYDDKNADRELDAYILDELMTTKVLEDLDMDEISKFVHNKLSVLSKISEKPNFLIGKYPVMVLLSYLLMFCPEYLYDKDIDIDTLKSLATQLNVNYDPTN